MISVATNDRCFEFRGKQVDFDQHMDELMKQYKGKLGNGSVFICMDTLNVYMFIENDKPDPYGGSWQLIS